MRVFVGIALPEAVQDALDPVQDRLPVGRLVDAGNLHLTLAFLDEQPQAVLQALHEALAAVRAQPFTLQLRGLGTFGARSPRIVWAGVRPEPELAVLRDRVRGAARRAGIDLPRERFRPHVTLARLGDRIAAEELDRLKTFLERFETFPSPPFEVDAFTLFESVRTKAGMVYEPLADYAFSK